jgi:uroporphyrinogen decarboxylase
MNSLERVATAITQIGTGTFPDKVPVAPLVCGASHRFSGQTYGEWSRGVDVEAFVEGHVDALEMIGHDGMVMLLDLSVEPEAFGMPVVYPEMDTAHPNYDDPWISSPDEYSKVKKIDPRKSGRMKFVIDSIKGLAGKIGGTHAIVGFVYGSMGTLSMMRGPEAFFMDCIECPEKVMEAIETIDEVLLDYAMAQLEAGCHSVCYDNLYASESIASKDLWRKFESKGMKTTCDAVAEAGALVSHHNCGNGIYFDEIIEWGHPHAVSHAYVADDVDSWEEQKQKWGPKTCTIGWVPPGPVAMLGTPEEIEEECKAQIEIYGEGAGFILATGCEFGPNASLRNAKRMVEARDKYGVYNQ